MSQRTAEELLSAVRQFLREQVLPELQGFKAYNTRVAANSLGIVARELQLGIDVAELAAEQQTYRPDGSLYSSDQLPLSRAVRQGETIQDEELIIRDVEGHDHWINAHAAPIRDHEGRVTAGIVVFHDITDQKRAQEDRERLIAKLEAQNAELERFTYTVSHDLKSPLITIKAFAGMVSKELAEAGVASVEDDLAQISNAADKMDGLLKDLLKLSRIGRLVNAPSEVSLEELAQDAIEIVGGQAKQNGVQVDISPHLPVVFGDRVRLLEVLQNLIDNAVKYMGDQPRPRVEIGSRRDDNQTIFYVRDNGIGIDPRHHEKVFGLFDQLDQKMEGSGIGLALVKRIIDVHGGRIWIESEGENHGSTFCFTIPEETKSREFDHLVSMK